MKKMARRLSIALLAMLMLTAFCVTAFAAENLLNGALSLSYTADNGSATANGTNGAMITSTGGNWLSKTTTATLTNFSGKKASVSFDWSVTNASSFTIADTTYSGSGTYTAELAAEGTIVIKLTAARKVSASAELSNITLTVAQDSSNVTFVYDSTLGSITVGDSSVTSGSTVTVPASGVAVTADANSDSTFYGWINTADNSIVSSSASFTLQPVSDMSVKPVFATSANACFSVGGTHVFEDLNAAGAYAASASSKTVVLLNNANLPAGDYTIPAGVTLLIPFDSSNTLYTTEPEATYTTSGSIITTYSGTYTTPTAFRTLTMADGASITVNGSISVSGKHSPRIEYNGCPSGPQGFIKMNNGSHISVENGGFLYAWGYITGSGTVEAKSGATVYENFQVRDFRGGDASSDMSVDTEHGVFIFSQYYLQNIEVPLTLHSGAREYGYMSVNVSAMINSSDVQVVGVEGDEAMFLIGSGYIVKDYIENAGRIKFETYGDFSISTISASMGTGLTSIDINSADYNLPIPGHMTVNAVSGNISINQSVALLPGSELYISEGVTATLGDGVRIIVYDLDQWKTTYMYNSSKTYKPLTYAPGGLGTTGREKDALVEVNGIVDATKGAAYTTTGGANIYSTGAGKVITTAGTDTVTYQGTQAKDGNDQVITYVSIPVEPAVLKNADGSYLSTAGASSTTYNYNAEHGKWVVGEHTFAEGVVTAPTCTTAGYTTHTCACGYSYTDAEKAATGHTEVIDAAVAATCTTTGKTEGKHCSVCGTVTVAQTEVAALGHTEVTDAAVDPTCTETGLTEGKHCSVCSEILVAQTEVAALGHTEVTDEAVAPTCTETGLTEGKHCSVCSEVLVAQEEVAALGHTEVIDEAVAPTVTTTGLTEGKHCSVCKEVLTAQEVIPCAEGVIDNWSMTLGSELTVNFGVRVNDTSASIVISVDGVEKDSWNVSDLNPENGIYYVSVAVAAAQMNDDISVQISNENGDIVAEYAGYSVVKYANALLGDSTQSNYHDLVKAMLNYGAAAQNYFGHNTENPANAGIEGFETVDVPTSASTGVSVSGSDEGIEYYGATLVFRDKIAVRFYFSGSSEGIEGAVTKGDLFYVEVANILPQDLDQAVSVTVGGLTVSYSPLNYIVRMNIKGTDNMKALMRALYNYHLAAEKLIAA